MSLKALLFALVTAAGPLTGCYVETPVYTTTTVPPASLAYVAPGVEVVTNWGYPAFFTDNFYWYFDGGVWYRAAYLGGPRVRVDVVPPVIARLPRPEGYAHYVPPRTVAVRSAPRVAIVRRR